MTLTDHETRLFAQFAQASVAVDSVEGFEHLVISHVVPLLPHGMLLAVIGQRRFDHLVPLQTIGVRYPPAARAHFADAIHIRERPVIERWLKDREATVIDVPMDNARLSAREIADIQTLGLGRLGVHGVPDLSSNMASYFSFAQVSTDLERGHVAALLTLLCPLLHVAICRLRTPPESNPFSTLTAIERELLRWLAAGRTNQEMAMLRERSPATIRNQLEKLYLKLGVSSRAEAVGLALSWGGL